MQDSEAILAYRASSAVEAHALVGQLAYSGIESRVLGESLQGAYGGIQLGGMDLPEVWVAGKDRDAAEPIIAAWRADHFPVGTETTHRRFQFPLVLLFIVMTYVALVFGTNAMNETTQRIFGPLLHVSFIVGFVIIAWTKYLTRRRQPD